MTLGSLPLKALCALSSGTHCLSHNLAPAHLAGLAVDPTVEGKERVQTGQLYTLKWMKRSWHKRVDWLPNVDADHLYSPPYMAEQFNSL